MTPFEKGRAMGLSNGALTLYAYMHDGLVDGTQLCCKSQRELASGLGVSKDMVTRNLKVLVKAGAVVHIKGACYWIAKAGTAQPDVKPPVLETRTSVLKTRTSLTKVNNVLESRTSVPESSQRAQVVDNLEKHLRNNKIVQPFPIEKADAHRVFDGLQKVPPHTPPPKGLYIYNNTGGGGPGEGGTIPGAHKFSSYCPPSVTQATWDAYMAARDENSKAKQTKRAMTLLVNRINDLETKGQIPEDLVKRATDGNLETGKCWTSVHPLKRTGGYAGAQKAGDDGLSEAERQALTTAWYGTIPSMPEQKTILSVIKRMGIKPKPAASWKDVAIQVREKLDSQRPS